MTFVNLDKSACAPLVLVKLIARKESRDGVVDLGELVKMGEEEGANAK
jgi:hypothetical protein